MKEASGVSFSALEATLGSRVLREQQLGQLSQPPFEFHSGVRFPPPLPTSFKIHRRPFDRSIALHGRFKPEPGRSVDQRGSSEPSVTPKRSSSTLPPPNTVGSDKDLHSRNLALNLVRGTQALPEPSISAGRRSKKNQAGQNQVERWFADIERHVLASRVFAPVSDLSRTLLPYVRQYNKPDFSGWSDKFISPRSKRSVSATSLKASR